MASSLVLILPQAGTTLQRHFASVVASSFFVADERTTVPGERRDRRLYSGCPHSSNRRERAVLAGSRSIARSLVPLISMFTEVSLEEWLCVFGFPSHAKLSVD